MHLNSKWRRGLGITCGRCLLWFAKRWILSSKLLVEQSGAEEGVVWWEQLVTWDLLSRAERGVRSRLVLVCEVMMVWWGTFMGPQEGGAALGRPQVCFDTDCSEGSSNRQVVSKMLLKTLSKACFTLRLMMITLFKTHWYTVKTSCCKNAMIQFFQHENHNIVQYLKWGPL